MKRAMPGGNLRIFNLIHLRESFYDFGVSLREAPLIQLYVIVYAPHFIHIRHKSLPSYKLPRNLSRNRSQWSNLSEFSNEEPARSGPTCSS